MKYSIFVFFALLLFACNNSKTAEDPGTSNDFIKAADISFLPEIEAYGTYYLDASGTEKDLPDMLKENGCNTIRIRLWHTPATIHSSLQEVTTLATRIKSKGFKLWLDIHYSDTWADPSAQTKPAAWNTLSFSLLQDSVYNYTRNVVALLHPDIVQAGNEINGGLLWPDGSSSNTANFTALLKKASAAIRSVDPGIKIMIHYAGLDGSGAFFDMLKSNAVDYNIIGLSYYPLWHGKNLGVVQSQVASLAKQYKKEVMLAETAYPFTLSYNDYTNNVCGLPSQLITDYPATPTGQHDYLAAIKQMMKTSGNGFCYWAPEWTAFKGATSTTGSSWENMALFDFTNKALPALAVFKE